MTRDLTRDAFVAVLRQHTYGLWACLCGAEVQSRRQWSEHVADVLFAAEVRA